MSCTSDRFPSLDQLQREAREGEQLTNELRAELRRFQAFARRQAWIWGIALATLGVTSAVMLFMSWLDPSTGDKGLHYLMLISFLVYVLLGVRLVVMVVRGSRH